EPPTAVPPSLRSSRAWPRRPGPTRAAAPSRRRDAWACWPSLRSGCASCRRSCCSASFRWSSRSPAPCWPPS
ncbi:MAG: hypothetical protein AVDCRST_MAG16-2021, partial [uncultured Frankineae bacterium]